jgi:hypothetical protein
MPDLTPRVEALESAMANMENIHAKLGWHEQQVLQGIFGRPRDLLIYYGWPSGFNAHWDNEKVAQDMARYGLVVLGAGLEDPSHDDHANTQSIMTRVQALNPACMILGYVTANQVLSAFEDKVDQWNSMGANGIFLDESGYDYGKTRAEFNERVEYVHGKNSSNIAFANAWNLNHVLGVVNDPSYPNSTYNSSEDPSALTNLDWVLLESFAVNTAAYQNDYEDKAQWAARVVQMLVLRAQFGVNVAGVAVIKDDGEGAQDMFDFAYVAALEASLDAVGSSDENYGSSSGKATHWQRQQVQDVIGLCSLNPSVQADANDGDVYLRFVQNAKLTLDFSSGEEASSITRF